jgi:hypothetical protein
LQIDEIEAYVRHRLRVAGLGENLFSADAIGEIARHSLGVARAVNQICSRALMLSEWRRERPISSKLIVEAIDDCPIDALVALQTPDIAQVEAIAAPERGMDLDKPAVEPALANSGPEAVAPVAHDLKADQEIDLPLPPSLIDSNKAAVEPRAGPAVAKVLPLGRKPSPRSSSRLREIARDRRRSLDNEVPTVVDTGARPRFSGFTARRRIIEPQKEVGTPHPIEKPRRRAWPTALAIVAIGFSVSIAVQRPLITPLARAIPDSLRTDINRLWSRIGTAAREVLESIRPGYHYERPPSSQDKSRKSAGSG